MRIHLNLYAAVLTSVLVVAAVLPCVSHANFWDGYKLKEWADADARTERAQSSPTDYQGAAYLVGFVTGISDAWNGILICLPSGVKAGQLTAMVKKYLFANPEKWNQAASLLVMEALVPTFPCKKKKK